MIILIVGFIFSRSLPDVTASQEESMRVTKLVQPFLELFVGRGNVTDQLVRKLAHFVEFGALGAALSALVWISKRSGFLAYGTALSFGGIVALTDETIQIFTGRGSLVQDVWLDIFGAFAGLTAVLCLRGICALIWRKKEKRAKGL